MTANDYEDLYDMWKRRAIGEGFRLNEFREHYGRYVEVSNVCMLTKALGAKLAYKSLCHERREDLKCVQQEMENVQWLY